MKILTLLIFFFIVTFSFAQPQVFTPFAPKEAGFSAERLQRLDNYLKEIVDKGIAPNAVTFVAHNGKIVHHKAFGYRNLEKKVPAQKDDIFRIASQTKAIATTALMILYEEGKFVLDDPISKYIPAFKNPTVMENYDKQTKKYTTRPAKSEITIRHLLSHTSGIPYDHPLGELPEYKIPSLASVERLTLAEAIPKLAKQPLMADPGENFIYGLNTDVVGYLVEVLSGTNLNDFIKSKILDPLGMTDTYFYLPEAKYSRLVELYSKASPEDNLTLHPDSVLRNFPVSGAKTYYSGGAGLVSTAENYARFAQMILNGGTFNNTRILSRKTIELMSTNQIGELEVWDRKDKFGLGFQIMSENSHYSDLASVNSLTWGGAYCSEFTIDPKENLILLVFTNVLPYSYYGDFVHKFRTLVYQALE